MQKAANGYEYDAYDNTDANANNRDNKQFTVESRNDVDVYNKNTDYNNTGSQNNSAGNAKDNQSDAGNVNEARGINVINEQNDIANGDGMEYKGEEDTIYGFKVIEGKIDGIIPVERFISVIKNSIKNRDADTDIMIVGRYIPTIENGVENWSKPSSESYNVIASKLNAMHFDLGEEFLAFQNEFNLSNEQMFNYFNINGINEAFTLNKKIVFTHDPREYNTGALVAEWEYIKKRLKLKDNYLDKGDVFVWQISELKTKLRK